MAPSSKPIPKHWKLVTQKQNDGSQISVYKCQATGQKYYKYENMMRYINYAKVAKMGIYDPYFGKRFWPPKKGGRPRKGSRSVVGESCVEKEKPAVTDSNLEDPYISSLEPAPAEEKAAVVDEQSETEEDPTRHIETNGSSAKKVAVVDEQPATEEDPTRHMETDGSSTEEDKRYRKKFVRKNKGKKLKG